VAGVGTVTWATPSGATTASDASVATADVRNPSPQTHHLVVDGLGFSIPSGATIDGIEVEVRRRSGAGSVRDAEVRLADGAALSTADRARSTAWPTSFAYATYGGATDTWGETWTPADVNASTFGVAISAMHTGGSPDDAYVDHVRVTVHYGFTCP